MTKIFDFTGQDYKRDMRPTLARMRDAGPIIETRFPLFGSWPVATTHAAVSEILKDAGHFASDSRNAGRKYIAAIMWWMPRRIRLLADSMLISDDPRHRRLRRFVDGFFRRQGIDAYRPAIAAVADGLIDRLAASDDGDLVRHVARELPLSVICDILGLPQEDRPKFTRWMAAMSSVSSAAGVLAMMPALNRMMKYLTRMCAARRAEPRDDLISALVAPADDGERLSEDEILSTCFLLFVAGHETTTHLISGGVLALLQNPGELERLKGDWSLAPSATDELLRFVTPVQMTKPRYAMADVRIEGVDIPRGKAILAMLASANFDPAVFDEPDRLDLTRMNNRHLAFGTGPHMCLGLHLARAEMEILLERLFARYPDLGLAVPESGLKWTKPANMRALTALPLKLNAPAAGRSAALALEGAGLGAG